MSRREIGCSSRAMILGSPIRGIVPNARTDLPKPLKASRLARMRVLLSDVLGRDSKSTRKPETWKTRSRRLGCSWPRAFVISGVCLACASWAPVRAADDPLARARLLYNQRQFQAAVTAAEEARSSPARADAADLVAARAYLE